MQVDNCTLSEVAGLNDAIVGLIDSFAFRPLHNDLNNGVVFTLATNCLSFTPINGKGGENISFVYWYGFSKAEGTLYPPRGMTKKCFLPTVPILKKIH